MKLFQKQNIDRLPPSGPLWGVEPTAFWYYTWDYAQPTEPYRPDPPCTFILYHLIATWHIVAVSVLLSPLPNDDINSVGVGAFV